MSGVGEPIWLRKARSYIGIKEIKGPAHEQAILDMARDARLGWIRDDETAWCSIFVCAVIERCGMKSTRSAAARSWSGWGMDVMNPYEPADIPLGAIVVYSRGTDIAKGHVGLAVGVNRDGHILTLGGNQADSVSIAPFHVGRIVSVRWPLIDNTDLKLLVRIPFVESTAALSSNEA